MVVEVSPVIDVGAPKGPGMVELVVRAKRLVADGREAPGSIGISGGRIVWLGPLDGVARAEEEIEFGADVVVLPGLVDSHVHICEPGNTDWEGFVTATNAAAAGGVTTLVDMPIDSVPPTIDVASLEEKRQAASGKCAVDVAFWGGVVPGNLNELVALHNAGVAGFKAFLVDSGAPGFPAVSEAELLRAAEILAPLGAVLLVHAELASEQLPATPGPTYADYLATRPPRSEDRAVDQVIDAARRSGGRLHIVHLSSAGALEAISAARYEDVALSVETCPHYLVLSAEEIDDGQTTAKCSPPVREASNRDALWEGLRRGEIDTIVSDHSPCTPEMKGLAEGDFAAAWGGIASIGLGLPLVWSEARHRGFSLVNVVSWMAEGPARLAGLARKGRIALGADADLCVFAPDECFEVDIATSHQRHPLSPYSGRCLDGVVRRTMLRGRWVDLDGIPQGMLLARGRSAIGAVS